MNSIKKKILDFQKFIKKKIFKTKNRYPTVAAMLIREDWSNEKQIISTKIAVLKKMNPIKIKNSINTYTQWKRKKNTKFLFMLFNVKIFH